MKAAHSSEDLMVDSEQEVRYSLLKEKFGFHGLRELKNHKALLLSIYDTVNRLSEFYWQGILVNFIKKRIERITSEK